MHLIWTRITLSPHSKPFCITFSNLLTVSLMKLREVGLDDTKARDRGKIDLGDKLMQQRTGQRDWLLLLKRGKPSTFREMSTLSNFSSTAWGYFLRCSRICPQQTEHTAFQTQSPHPLHWYSPTRFLQWKEALDDHLFSGPSIRHPQHCVSLQNQWPIL